MTRAPHDWRPEAMRKTVHVGMGCACLALPWLFADEWPVLLLAAGFAALLLGLRNVPALRAGPGRALFGVKRRSLGELWFVAAVALTFCATDGDPLRFCIPVAVLTFADSAAALVGSRFQTDRKTPQGSAAFLVVAVMCVFLPVVTFTPLRLMDALALSLVAGALTAVIERVSVRGLDNLLVPLGVALVVWPAL